MVLQIFRQTDKEYKMLRGFYGIYTNISFIAAFRDFLISLDYWRTELCYYNVFFRSESGSSGEEAMISTGHRKLSAAMSMPVYPSYVAPIYFNPINKTSEVSYTIITHPLIARPLSWSPKFASNVL